MRPFRRSTRAAKCWRRRPAAASCHGHEDLRISKILKREAFQNAIRANAAIGGSTNAVIHLLAFAGRVGVPLTLDDWDRYGRDVRTILDIQPSGRFLMEDFYYAGGLPAVLSKLASTANSTATRSP
jgi:L-arabonate dehydrase